MAANTTAGGLPARTDSASHLSLAFDSAVPEHPDVVAWFAEAKRLFAEAAERFEGGEILRALSSLAAVPPLHRTLIERCSELLAEDEETLGVEPAPPVGMYL